MYSQHWTLLESFVSGTIGNVLAWHLLIFAFQVLLRTPTLALELLQSVPQVTQGVQTRVG
jgi:hypothetical protein